MKIMFAILLLSSSAHAAISKSVVIEAALRQPLPQRLGLIEKEGLRGQHELQKIAFNSGESLENRWRAITSYGRIYKGEAQPFLDKALRSPEWYMRNAALVVAPYADRTWAIRWARILIHDRALVVRTAAVQALRQLNAADSQGLLWEKFYSSENFRNGKSLWVRRHIIEALAQFAKPTDAAEFVKVLSDKDASLHPVAIQALAKITRQKFTTTAEWQQWMQKTL